MSDAKWRISQGSLKPKTHSFKNVSVSSILEPPDQDDTFTGTKIFSTLGPSSYDVDTLVAMLEAGMAGVRIDFSGGDLDFHRTSLANLQIAMQRARKLCAVALGPIGREVLAQSSTAATEETAVKVSAGQKVVLTTDTSKQPAENVFTVLYPKFVNMVTPGDTVYLSRWLVCGADKASVFLEVHEVIGQDVVCIAQNDAEAIGQMTVFHIERSNASLLNAQNDLDLFSQQDINWIAELSREFEVDFLLVPYTKSGEDIRQTRFMLDSMGLSTTKILAKVETRMALLNFRGILTESDGICFCRGNVGLDCPPEKIALIQKHVINICNMLGKPVSITRVVDSMVETPRPTRAEATDVANAVLDGVDAFQLGAETQRGKYPVEAIRTISGISRQAEKMFDYNHHFEDLMAAALAAEVESDNEGDSGGGSPSMSHADLALATNGWPTHGPVPPTALANQGDHSHLHVNFADPSASAAVAATAATAIMHTYTATTAGMHPPPLPESGAVGGDRPMRSQPTLPLPSMNSRNLRTINSGPVERYSLAMATKALMGLASTNSLAALGKSSHSLSLYTGSPYLSKMESIASSSVRAAEKCAAKLIIVFTDSSRCAQLVAKYRPPMPILTLVAPSLVTQQLKWHVTGKEIARQCLLVRGLLPVLAAPRPTQEMVLDEAVSYAASLRLVKPNDHVVIVQKIHKNYELKVVSVDAAGWGIKKNDPYHNPPSRRTDIGIKTALGSELYSFNLCSAASDASSVAAELARLNSEISRLKSLTTPLQVLPPSTEPSSPGAASYMAVSAFAQQLASP